MPGTGFQAGGPSCLLRFCTEQAVTVNMAAVAGNLALPGELRDRGEGTPVRHYSGGRLACTNAKLALFFGWTQAGIKRQNLLTKVPPLYLIACEGFTLS